MEHKSGCSCSSLVSVPVCSILGNLKFTRELRSTLCGVLSLWCNHLSWALSGLLMDGSHRLARDVLLKILSISDCFPK
jgi:hypothetical protein